MIEAVERTRGRPSAAKVYRKSTLNIGPEYDAMLQELQKRYGDASKSTIVRIALKYLYEATIGERVSEETGHADTQRSRVSGLPF